MGGTGHAKKAVRGGGGAQFFLTVPPQKMSSLWIKKFAVLQNSLMALHYLAY